MYRATTPTQIAHFAISLSSADEIQLTYSQKGKIVLEKHLSDLTLSEDGKTVSFDMTESESKLFASGVYEIQYRVSIGGKVITHKPLTRTAEDVLHDNNLIPVSEDDNDS